ICLNELEPEPSFGEKLSTYYTFIDDSLLNLLVSQNIYNQVNLGDSIVKKTTNDSIEVNGKKIPLLSNEKYEWLAN
ncbi:hypothetical protein LJC11_05390, partial [Bacteroidales bacterium OttesenSCG-928-I21]|nr:hypothetical protein [Bacteroidales bacterium OttesenSCG-928-I21]